MAGEAAEQIGLEGTVNMENEDRSVIYTNTRNVIETGILTGSINLWPVVIVAGGIGVLIVILAYIYSRKRSGQVRTQKMTEEKSRRQRYTGRDDPAQEKGKKGSKGILRELLFLLIKIVVITAVVMLIFTVMFGIYRSADISMHPSIKDGDLVIFYRLDRNTLSRMFWC